MDNNEIMVNEEVMKALLLLELVNGVGLAALGSVIAYKYVVKPIVAKIKAKKAQERIDGESINHEDYEFEEFDENN